MFQAARKHVRAIATIGLASALVMAGVAAAQGESQGGAENGQGSTARALPPPMGGPMGGPTKGLTYAVFHVQKNGTAQVIRLDQGKITAVDNSSITLAENDGNSVSVALDENTEVFAKPGEESKINDLSVGEQVTVSGPEGAAAKSVMVMPKPGEMKGAPFPPPPQGAPRGGEY